MEPDGTRGAFRPFCPHDPAGCASLVRWPHAQAGSDTDCLSPVFLHSGAVAKAAGGASPNTNLAHAVFEQIGVGMNRPGSRFFSPAPAVLHVVLCAFAGDVSDAPYSHGTVNGRGIP